MTCIYPKGCVDPIRCGTASRCCATPAPPRYACSYGLGCEGPDCKHDDCPRKTGTAPAFTPDEGEKSARDYEHGYNDGVEWTQTRGLIPDAAQSEKVPDAWQVLADNGHWLHFPTHLLEDYRKAGKTIRPLYATQPPAAPVMQDSIEAIISGIGAADTPAEQAFEIVHKLGRAGYAIVKYGDVPAAPGETLYRRVELGDGHVSYEAVQRSSAAPVETTEDLVLSSIETYRECGVRDPCGEDCPNYVEPKAHSRSSAGSAPVAWYFEVAQCRDLETGELYDWHSRVTQEKPTYRDMRNLTPLFRGEPPASASMMTSGEIFTYLRERMKDQTSASLAVGCRALADNLRVMAAQQSAATDDAIGYAQRLATSLWEKHYKDDAPAWKPLPDLVGVLTQIDNATACLIRAVPQSAEVTHAAQFLLDRLDEFDPGEDEPEREYHGHVAPAIARLRSALTRPQHSPTQENDHG